MSATSEVRAAIVAACLAHFIAAWSSPEVPATLDTHGLPRGLLSFFLGVLVYALAPSRKDRFDAAARMPLQED